MTPLEIFALVGVGVLAGVLAGGALMLLLRPRNRHKRRRRTFDDDVDELEQD